jgi:hypothetical protein
MSLFLDPQRSCESFEFGSEFAIACEQEARTRFTGHFSKSLEEDLMVFHGPEISHTAEHEATGMDPQRASSPGAGVRRRCAVTIWNSVRNDRHRQSVVGASATFRHLLGNSDHGKTPTQAPALQPPQSELGIPFGNAMDGMDDTRGVRDADRAGNGIPEGGKVGVNHLRTKRKQELPEIPDGR